MHQMTKVSMIAVATLLLAGCRLGAAAPDDEQVLVQRGAFVTQEINVEGHKTTQAARARRAFAGKVREITDRIREHLLKRQANPVFGTAGEACTREQEAAYTAAEADYEKKQREGGMVYRKHFMNHTVEILKIMLDPLIAAGNVMLQDTNAKLNTPMLNILKYYLIQSFKPHDKYAAGEIVPTPEQSQVLMAQFAADVAAGFRSRRETISQSWTELDELLTKVAKETEMPTTEFHVPMDKVPQIDWEANTTNLPEYFITKALPIILIELFPRLVRPIKSLLGQIPKMAEDPESVIQSSMQAFTDLYRALDSYREDAEVFKPNSTLQPQRVCKTCKEAYDEGVATVGEGGCAMYCLETFNECSVMVDKECVRSAHSCLSCNLDRLSDLDNCTGNFTHEKSIKKLRFLAAHLRKASTERGFENFLGNASMMIIKGDEYLEYTE